MIKDRLFSELTQRMIPFWYSLQDKERGGCLSYMDGNGRIDPLADKPVLLLCRSLYFFSSSYRLTGDKAMEGIADSYFDYLVSHYIDTDGGIIYSVDCDGNPKDRTKNIYFHSFALYASVEYYRAFSRGKAKTFAMRLYDYMEETFRARIAYNEQVQTGKQFENVIADSGVRCAKTMNSLLHILEAYTLLYAETLDARVGDSLRRLLRIFTEKIYDPQRRRLNVFFDEKLCSVSEYHSYGHDIEASWLLDFAAETLNDAALRRRVYAMTDTLVESVYENAFDGIALYNEMVEGVVDKSRIWWVQAEAVCGFLRNYSRTHNQKYYEAAQKILEYIFAKIISPDLEWYWCVGEDGVADPKYPMVSGWKCPYHNGRMLINTIAWAQGQEKKE